MTDNLSAEIEALALVARAITLHYSNHPTYGSTSVCGGGFGGSMMTAHCAYLCDNPAHDKERDGWEEIRAEYDRLRAILGSTTPHVVETAEGLRALDGQALRLACGWVVVVEVLADSTNFLHGDHVTDVLVWLNEDDGENVFPAKVLGLTPAPAPADREAIIDPTDEALVERVADAIDEHRYSLIDIGKCVCGVKNDNMPDHQARAVLDVIEGVRRG